MRPIKKREPKEPPAAKPAARQEVDRLIAKGWFKDAIKQAKLVHRAEPTAEHHRLLEQAYFLRAQELREKAMPKAAQEVAIHLLDFGITDPAIIEPAAAMLMAVGLERQALDLHKRLDAPDALDRLIRLAADQAVLHPERASATPEIREGARLVRATLEALTTATAASPDPLDGLREVARNSPFADWRLFARGLAAFRRGNDADARANWDRLDPNRSASKIARTSLGPTGSNPGVGSASTRLEALERKTFGEPVLGPLGELSDLVGKGLWPEVVRKLTLVRLALRRFDPRLAIRLTEALYSLIIREATELDYRQGQSLLKNFSKAAEPLPIDPRWNRLWALAWEAVEGPPEESGKFWKHYVDDLETCQALQPKERVIARSLVLAHHGSQWADHALDLEDHHGIPSDDPRVVESRRRAVSLFEKSLELFPTHRPAYQSLMEVYDEGGQSEKAAEVAERLIQALPDDLETLTVLAKQGLKRDEPVKGLEFAVRARKLKPLDQDLLMVEWGCRVARARHLAWKEQWDEARAELAIAAGLSPDLAGSPHFAARRACLEIKAGETTASKTIIDETVKRLEDPAPFWLAMAIEAERYKLPKTEVSHHEIQWEQKGLSKPRGETAGALATLLLSFHVSEMTYPRRDIHTKQLLAYLQKTTRIKYQRDDLVTVCQFVGKVSADHALLEKLAKRGVKLFPEAAEFPMMLGIAALAKGPSRANLVSVDKYLNSALKLAQAEEATRPGMAALISEIKKLMTALPRSGSGPMDGLPESFLDAFEEMMDEMNDGPDEFFDAFDEYDDPWIPGPLPSPPPSPRPPSKKKKR